MTNQEKMTKWNEQNPHCAFDNDEINKFIKMYELDLIVKIKEPKAEISGLDILRNARWS